jgi:hypothetical protein
MTPKPFQFGEAAKLYVENLEIMREMREETYRSIAEFGDKLIKHLPHEIGEERLCHRKTFTQGTYYGGEINYLWIGRNAKEEWNKKIGFAYLVFPMPGKVVSEEHMSHFGIFDILRNNKIRIIVSFPGVSSRLREKITSLASNKELGELIEKKEDEFSLWINFDQADPVVSASESIVKLLRAINNAQKAGE